MKPVLKLAAPACALAAVLSACSGGGGLEPFMTIETVGNRADLISGGDALVRVRLPRDVGPEDARLEVNGEAIDTPLRPAPDGVGYLALIDGMAEGANQVRVTAQDRTVALDILSHPNGGPVFSGEQIQPWTCREGALNEKCDRPVKYEFVYMPSEGGRFAPYDIDAPAEDVASVTTDGGVTLPFIVRVERFNQNRSGVATAALFDPTGEWTPFEPQPQWNGGVLVLQGAGCGTSYFDQPAGSPLNEQALADGFVVVSVALLHNTINCNPVVQAEAAMMAKEHVAETYGPFDLIFGMGSSGGAISQLMDQNAYPGLYDGLIINHSFPDSDASRMNSYDCGRVYAAMEESGLEWTDEAKSAVVGMISGCDSHTRSSRYLVYNPGVGTGCDVPDDAKFDADENPDGVRCTLQDYERNQVGVDEEGRAYGRIDTEGVQYGLSALLEDAISPEQFVALNAGIGGHDRDYNFTEARASAAPEGLPRLYETGINNTAANYEETALLETRIWVTDFHQPVHTDMLRARILRAQGHADNHAIWRFEERGNPAYDSAFDTMVSWLRAIRDDDRNVPLAWKVRDNRPEAAADRCFPDTESEGEMSACAERPPLIRHLAGAPMENDIGKCQLKALSRESYGDVTFTDEQWSQMEGIFPTGVCDWDQPLVGYAETIPWLTYGAPGQYEPLGPAPESYEVGAD